MAEVRSGRARKPVAGGDFRTGLEGRGLARRELEAALAHLARRVGGEAG